MAQIPEGYGLIAGRSRKNAQAALEAADRAGVPVSEVKAIQEGYVVPQAALDAYVAPGTTGDTTPADVTYVDGSKPEVGDDGLQVLEEHTPTEDWKNADIAAWAEDHGVDLGGATKKADMLAAIGAGSE